MHVLSIHTYAHPYSWIPTQMTTHLHMLIPSQLHMFSHTLLHSYTPEFIQMLPHIQPHPYVLHRIHVVTHTHAVPTFILPHSQPHTWVWTWSYIPRPELSHSASFIHNHTYVLTCTYVRKHTISYMITYVCFHSCSCTITHSHKLTYFDSHRCTCRTCMLTQHLMTHTVTQVFQHLYLFSPTTTMPSCIYACTCSCIHTYCWSSSYIWGLTVWLAMLQSLFITHELS